MAVPENNAVVRLEGWHESWLIFAAYDLVVFVLFYFCFKVPNDKHESAKAIDSTFADPENDLV